nr:MAG TPA: Plasmid maintenance system killer protein [Caudoviricetes sp.]
MRYSIQDKKLQKLADGQPVKGYPAELGKAFRKCLNYIKAAKNIRDLQAMRSLHCEEYRDRERRERSLQLNDQYHLMFLLDAEEIVICSIRYH